jgi:hypothetical protein
MSTMLAALPIAAAVLVSSSPPSREIENVAAFARLYGVVRFFLPQRRGGRIDWNRFAVLGVGRARAARDPRATLRQRCGSSSLRSGPAS